MFPRRWLPLLNRFLLSSNRLTACQKVDLLLSLRVSRVSRTAAILIIAIGVFTLIVGLATAIVEDTAAGVAFVVLGVFLYWFLYRFTRRVEKEIDAKGS